MTLSLDDIVITKPIFHSPDHTNKVGGGNSFDAMNYSDVNGVFMPGMIKDDDFSDVTYDQYAKIFLFNKSFTDTAYDTKVYGYNISNNNIVKMALEKDNSGNPVLDGEEETINRLTPPSLFGAYAFSEIHSNDAVFCGSGGDIPPRSGQGIWLKMHTDSSDTSDALDTFKFGVKFKQENVV